MRIVTEGPEPTAVDFDNVFKKKNSWSVILFELLLCLIQCIMLIQGCRQVGAQAPPNFGMLH